MEEEIIIMVTPQPLLENFANIPPTIIATSAYPSTSTYLQTKTTTEPSLSSNSMTEFSFKFSTKNYFFTLMQSTTSAS